MYSFTIRIANNDIEIETIHIRPQAICQKFIVSEHSDLKIQITQEDINRDRADYEKAIGFCEKWDGYLEVFTLLHEVSNLLIDHGAFLLHGAAIAVNDEALIFTGNSGIGKTTHIRKWLESISNTFVINGDKPFIYMGNMKKPMACGSPWAGKENMYTNTMIPLKAIILLERSEDNFIQRISFSEAFPVLYQQIYRPENNIKMRKTLAMLCQLSPLVSFWRFQCNNFKDDCLKTVYDAIIGGSI